MADKAKKEEVEAKEKAEKAEAAERKAKIKARAEEERADAARAEEVEKAKSERAKIRDVAKKVVAPKKPSDKPESKREQIKVTPSVPSDMMMPGRNPLPAVKKSSNLVASKAERLSRDITRFGRMQQLRKLADDMNIDSVRKQVAEEGDLGPDPEIYWDADLAMFVKYDSRNHAAPLTEEEQDQINARREMDPDYPDSAFFMGDEAPEKDEPYPIEEPYDDEKAYDKSQMMLDMSNQGTDLEDDKFAARRKKLNKLANYFGKNN